MTIFQLDMYRWLQIIQMMCFWHCNNVFYANLEGGNLMQAFGLLEETAAWHKDVKQNRKGTDGHRNICNHSYITSSISLHSLSYDRDRGLKWHKCNTANEMLITFRHGPESKMQTHVINHPRFCFIFVGCCCICLFGTCTHPNILREIKLTWNKQMNKCIHMFILLLLFLVRC